MRSPENRELPIVMLVGLCKEMKLETFDWRMDCEMRQICSDWHFGKEAFVQEHALFPHLRAVEQEAGEQKEEIHNVAENGLVVMEE